MVCGKYTIVKSAETEKRFFNLKEAASYLGRSPQLIRRMAEAGAIPCKIFQNGKSSRKTYFFTRDALDRWAEAEACADSIDFDSLKINPAEMLEYIKTLRQESQEAAVKES